MILVLGVLHGEGGSQLAFGWSFRAVEVANSVKFTYPIRYSAVGFSAAEGDTDIGFEEDI